MNNEQIIFEIALQELGEEFVMQLLDEGREIPLHTLQGWRKRRGDVKIRKGEKGISCKLWKKKEKKLKREDNIESQKKSFQNEYYLCTAYLFREEQLEQWKK